MTNVQEIGDVISTILGNRGWTKSHPFKIKIVDTKQYLKYNYNITISKEQDKIHILEMKSNERWYSHFFLARHDSQWQLVDVFWKLPADPNHPDVEKVTRNLYSTYEIMKLALEVNCHAKLTSK